MLNYLVQRAGVEVAWLLIAIASIGVVSYCFGCCNGAVMISRGILKDDIRKHGSGNGGLTNFCRIHGGFLSILVIFIDVMKAVLSLLLAGYIFSYLSPAMVVPAKYWAAVCCILGHMFPCMFQFRGGKGAMSSGAIALMIDWRLALAVLAILILATILTDYIVIGTFSAIVTVPVYLGFFLNNLILMAIVCIASVAIFWKHRENIGRMIRKEEIGLRSTIRGDKRYDRQK